MSDASEFEDLVPSAARLTENFRDLGYEFESAVADLLDNSISAGATRVNVSIAFDGPNSWIRITDNGQGMDAAELSESMRLGSNRSYDDSDLGKFGMGLKTASLSQSRLITVASRRAGDESVSYRQLDLDHVVATDRWQIRTRVDEDSQSRVEEALTGLNSGTVVMWQKLDRLLTFRDPWGGWAERHLLGLAERLEAHLAMVFSTFLSRPERLEIVLNDNVIEAWDPFSRDQEHTEVLPSLEVPVRAGLVRVTPYVLPAKPDFSTELAWRRASGPRQWNRQQGFYVFRADRMIQAGGWSGMRTSDEHGKLARVAIEFWPDLDDAFEINISKMRVKLPEELKESISGSLRTLNSRANARYRGANKAPRSSAATATSVPSPNDGSAVETVGARTPAAPILPLHPVQATERLSHVGALIESSAAKVGFTTELQAIRAQMLTENPIEAREIGW